VPTYDYLPMERIRFGEPAAAALAAEVDRLGATRVYLMASATLRRTTSAVVNVEAALGARLVGVFDQMPPFAPRESVAMAANEARALGADLIATFGGGSLTDAGKIVRIVTQPDGRQRLPAYEGPSIPQVSIPTTLSAGEINSQGGSLEPRTGRKQSYKHPLLTPRVVIYDPASTIHTPAITWLSTGVRALDHAVELYCAANANPLSEPSALQALRLLSRALPSVKRDPLDLAARLDCQLGAALSLQGLAGGVHIGLSHGIGHILGALCSVPHGVTSCLILPHAMRFNREVSGERHQAIAEALGRPGGDAADMIERLIADLGLPQRLSEVGVFPASFRDIAEHAMSDICVHTNPRKVRGPDDIVEILERAA
jgi:maleylacetate reductase